MKNKSSNSLDAIDTVLLSIAEDFAIGLKAADERKPVALNKKGEEYDAGIGPHQEDKATKLAVKEMQRLKPERYSSLKFNISYPKYPKQKCDLLIDTIEPHLYLEIKLLRPLGNNNRSDDNMPKRILSPYREHRSAVTDTEKLRDSEFPGRKAVMIFGFEAKNWPLLPAVEAFELLARDRGKIGLRHTAEFRDLCHPVHQSGAVFIWEVL